MTTNVIDLAAKVVASDSRWSFRNGNELHFVDDTSFDKIAVNEDAVMVCAGDSELIGEWREWLAKPDFFNVTIPDTHRDRGGQIAAINVALITRPEGELLYCKGVYILVDGMFLFAGSGGEFARTCFTANFDVDRCITSAASSDDHTGGTVRKVDVVSGQSNLAHPSKSVQDIQDCYSQRGVVMDLVTRTKKPVPAGTAANDQVVQAKQFHFSAPTGQDAAPWSNDDHVRLGKALQVLADRATARRSKD